MKKLDINKNGLAFIMGILLVTKVLGFIKLRTIAQLFGATHELDIFWAAFTIPDMIFTILVAGSINAAVIPILSEIFYKKGKEKLDIFFNRLSLLISAISVIVAIIFFIFTPQITNSIINSEFLQKALNFSQRISAQDFDLFVYLTRIMLLSPILLAVSSLFTAYLQTKKQFFVTFLAPLFYNLALILGPIFFVVFLKQGVEGIAFSTVLASLLHLLIQVPTFIKGYEHRYSFSWSTLKASLKDAEVFKAFKLAIPRTIAIVGDQATSVINTLISFSLQAGALSAYKFALSLHQFPINIIGSAVAQLALPDLSQYSEPEDRDKFAKVFNSAIQLSLYLVLPVIAVFVVLRLPIVRLVYGSGAFDWRATLLTAWCLVMLAFSMLGQTIDQIILRAFYALKKTWVPLVSMAVSIVFDVILAYGLTNFFSHYYDWRPIVMQMFSQISHADGAGFWPVFVSFVKDFFRWSSTRGDSDMAVGGLSLALGLSYMIEITLLYIMLNAQTKIVTWKNTFKPFFVKLLNTILMGIGMYFVFKLFDFKLDTTRTVYVIILTAATTAYGALSYWLGSRVLRIEEVDTLEGWVKRRVIKLFKK